MTTRIIKHPRTTWTDIVNPTQGDISALRARYPQFHELHLHDCLTELEFPKLDHFDSYIYLVIHIPYYDGNDRISRPSEVDVFVAKGVLVTSHQGHLKRIDHLFDEMEKDATLQEAILGHGATHLLYELLHRLVKKGLPMLQKINQDIRHIEDNLFSDNTPHILREIAIVRRNVIALRHTLRPQLDVVRALEQGNWDFINEELDFYWSDISDQLRQLRAMLDEQFEVINSLSDTIDTLSAHRIDEVVRILTVITLISVPLTVLSTVFGMNVALPYGSHPWAFFVVNTIGIVLTIGLIWYLRRRRWL